MFKKVFLALSLIFALTFAWAQGLETFENHTLSGTNYVNGSFEGINGITWNYVHVTGQQGFPIQNQGIILRRSGDNSKIYSGTISGGIGSFSIQMRKAFTGSGARQIALYINDTHIADSQTFGAASGEDETVHNFSVENINISGDIVIEVRHIQGGSSNRQLTIDNLSWTAFGGGPPPPSISVTGTLTPFSVEVGSPSADQSYTVTGNNLTASISVQAPAGFQISSDGTSYQQALTLAATYNGLVYVRLDGQTVGDYSGNITHNSSDASEVTLAVSGTVTEPDIPPPPGIFLEENFIYTAGTTLASNGWIAHSGGGSNSPTVTDFGLTYPGYPPALGFAGQTFGNGEDVHKNFEPQTSGEIYTSFLISVTSASEAGDYTYHFSTNADNTTDFKAKFFVGRNAENQIRFGLTKQSNVGASVNWTDYDYALGTPYLVVLKYQFEAGTGNDHVSGWINPVIGATEPTPMLTGISTETDIGALGIGSVGIRQTTTTPVAIFDGIRVTNNWASLWSGDAPPTPEIIVSGDLDPLFSIAGSPSEEHTSYSLSGEHLQGAITITAPEGFEVSDDLLNWAASIQVPASFDDLIYVRLNASAIGTYGGDINHTSPGAENVTIRVEGEALAPDVEWNLSATTLEFEATAGDDPVIQSYTLSATGASADILTSISEGPFEFSHISNNGPWFTNGNLPSTFNGTIYVKMNTSTAGTFNGRIKHSTTNAADAYVELSGTVNPPAGIYATDLFISEYIEGSSNNKALEIYNGTGFTVDLSNYRLLLYANGAATPTNTYVMSGTLAHQGTFVIAHSSANSTIMAIADVTSSVVNYNGDDAVALQKMVDEDWVNIDIFGMIGQDPGTAWTAEGGYSTLDKTLVRKPTVTQGVSVNPSGYENNNVNAFETLGTEWEVHPIDTITNLGSHVFSPGAEVATAPIINPQGGLQSGPIQVTMSSPTPGAVIYYTLDGTVPSDGSTLYSDAFTLNTTTTVKAITYADGYTPSAVSVIEYLFPTPVSNIAELRSQPTGASHIFQLTSEAIITYQNENRHTKYIQDATAAIVIDDVTGKITTQYNLYDGITGIVGYLNLYSQLVQFVPMLNTASATSTDNVVVPEVRTLASLTPADQAKLIKVMNVDFVNPSGDFTATPAQNLNVTDPSGAAVLRTFVNTDYAGTPIPTETVNITCLVGQFNADMQISSRFLSDFEEAEGQLAQPAITITETDDWVTITWEEVPGANGYIIYGSDKPEPLSEFQYVDTVTGTSFSEAAADGKKKFYYVIAE